MRVYKLFRKMKDGQLASLFINKKDRLPINTWLTAEFFPTKGYTARKGWHCTKEAKAPHLTEKGRVWCEVEIKDYSTLKKPEHQGGEWFLANEMRIIKEI